MSNLIKATSEGLVLGVSDRFGYIIDKPIINKNIIYTPFGIALREHAEREASKETDKAQYDLEFFSVWLDAFEYSKARRRTPAAYQGMQSGEFEGPDKNSRLAYQAVPVDLTYTITFWTLYKERIDAFLTEYVFWQSSAPYLDLFYDNNRQNLRFPLFVEPIPHLDNTVADMYVQGKYWRHTIRVRVEAWLIKDISYTTIKRIHLEIYADSTGQQIKSDENLMLSVWID